MPKLTSILSLKLRKPDPKSFPVELMFKVGASLGLWLPSSYVAMPNVVNSILLTCSSVPYIIGYPVHPGLPRALCSRPKILSLRNHLSPGQIGTVERLSLF